MTRMLTAEREVAVMARAVQIATVGSGVRTGAMVDRKLPAVAAGGVAKTNKVIERKTASLERL